MSVTHGIPEAIFAGVIVTPIALALRKALRKDVQNNLYFTYFEYL